MALKSRKLFAESEVKAKWRPEVVQKNFDVKQYTDIFTFR